MLKIRLQRIGRKNDPAFRTVLTDSKNSTKSGKFLEILGTYNPKLSKKEDRISLKSDRIKYWLSKGAQLSDTMHNFLVQAKIIEGKKINVLPKKKPTQKKKEAKEGPKEEKSTEAKAPAGDAPSAEPKAEPTETVKEEKPETPADKPAEPTKETE